MLADLHKIQSKNCKGFASLEKCPNMGREWVGWEKTRLLR